MGDLKDAKGVVDQGDLQLRDSSSDDSTQEFKIQEGYCAKQVMTKINKIRKSDAGYCDLNVEVEGIVFPAHKIILAGFSPYFERRILDKHGKHVISITIEVTGMTADTFQSVLDFAYTNRIAITDANVESLFRAATLIEASHLSEVCEEYLGTKINSKNFLKFSELASELSSSVLADWINKYILRNFSELCQQGEFLELKTEMLIDAIKSDELEVPDEEVVLDAVIEWINHQKDRKDLLPKIFTYLRWAYINPAVLNKWIEKDDGRTNSPDFTYWVSKALLYKSGYKSEVVPAFAKTRHSFISNANQPSLPVPDSGFQVILCERNDMGGFSGPLYLFNIENGNTRQLKPLPDEKCSIASVAFTTDFVYVVSEKTSNAKISGCIFRYCLFSDTWTTLSVFTSTAQTEEDLLVVDECLYTSSRRTLWVEPNVQLTFLHEHNIEYNTWNRLAKERHMMVSPSFVYANKMIYAISGTIDSYGAVVARRAIVQRYDTRTNKWTIMSSLFCDYEKYLCCYYKEKIYVFDGRQDNREATRMKLQVYDISKDKWELGPPLNKVYRNPIALVVVNGHLTFVDKTRFPLLQIERLSSEKNLWEIVDTQVSFKKGWKINKWHCYPRQNQS